MPPTKILGEQVSLCQLPLAITPLIDIMINDIDYSL